MDHQIIIKFPEEEIVESQHTNNWNQRERCSRIENGIEMHSKSIHQEEVHHGIEHDHKICYPQIWNCKQSNTAPIQYVQKCQWKVEKMDIGHKKSKIEFEEIPSFFSFGNGFEVDDGY